MTKPSHDNEPSRADQAAAVGLLTIDSRRVGEAHVIALAGELDLAHAGELEQELKRIEQTDAASITLDLSKLSFIDSTGVRILLLAEARSRADSYRLTLVRAPASVQRVFVICGVDGVLPFGD
jgi:anti-sigma B factor antagonist